MSAWQTLTNIIALRCPTILRYDARNKYIFELFVIPFWFLAFPHERHWEKYYLAGVSSVL